MRVLALAIALAVPSVAAQDQSAILMLKVWIDAVDRHIATRAADYFFENRRSQTRSWFTLKESTAPDAPGGGAGAWARTPLSTANSASSANPHVLFIT